MAPPVQKQLSLSNLINIGILVVGLTGGFFGLKYTSASHDDDIKRIDKEKLSKEVYDADQRTHNIQIQALRDAVDRNTKAAENLNQTINKVITDHLLKK